MATPDILDATVQSRDIGIGRSLSQGSLDSLMSAFTTMPIGVSLIPRVIPGINYVSNKALEKTLARFPRSLEPDEIEELTEKLITNGIESGKLQPSALEPVTATIVGIMVDYEEDLPSSLHMRLRDVPDTSYSIGFQMTGEHNALRLITGNSLRQKGRSKRAPWLVLKPGNVRGNEERIRGPELQNIPALMGSHVTVNPVGITVAAEQRLRQAA